MTVQSFLSGICIGRHSRIICLAAVLDNRRILFKFAFLSSESMKYICTVCGHVYDEAAEGTPFNELPEDWVCPLCGVGKDLFEPEEA